MLFLAKLVQIIQILLWLTDLEWLVQLFFKQKCKLASLFFHVVSRVKQTSQIWWWSFFFLEIVVDFLYCLWTQYFFWGQLQKQAAKDWVTHPDSAWLSSRFVPYRPKIVSVKPFFLIKTMGFFGSNFVIEARVGLILTLPWNWLFKNKLFR